METSRKVRQGVVEIDYDKLALEVNFEIETVQIDQNGRTVEVVDRKPEMRRIKINSLSPDKNLAVLAEQIVKSCKYIHPSRTEEIEQLLIKLRKYTMENSNSYSNEEENSKMNDANNQGNNSRRRSSKYENSNDRNNNRNYSNDYNNEEKNDRDRDKDRGRKPPKEQLPPANMDDLDDYMELLYQVGGRTEKEKEQTHAAQVRGTAMILSLCRNVLNLEQLIQNGTVMGALTRVLQEEYKKSVELSFNILRIFLAFSNFVEMHPLMTNYRIGVLTMKALELQVNRTEHRKIEQQTKEEIWNLELKQAREIGGEEGLDRVDKIRMDKAKDIKTQRNIAVKENKLMFVALHVLINLAEDVTVERKMIKKNLIESLITLIENNSSDLLILIVTFLKKLSCFAENKDVMKELGVIQRVARFIPCSSQALVNSTLRLLFNLSFDEGARDQMIRCGLVPRLVELLKTPPLRSRTLKLLYHLSVDDRCKEIFYQSDGISILMMMIIKFPQDHLTKELAALAVNLSLSEKNAEAMVSNRGLNHLMDRLFNTRDPLLFKIVRNISQWTQSLQEVMAMNDLEYKYRGLWSPHIKGLVQVLHDTDDHETLVEAFGIMGNLSPEDLPHNQSWSKLLTNGDLLTLVSRMLVPGLCQNDILLEVILMLSSCASDPKACDVLAKSNIINSLYNIWQDKADADVEIQLQLIHLFHKLLVHPKSRDEVMYSTRIVVDIINCLSSPYGAVRRSARDATDLVMELDREEDGTPGNLGLQILKKRYEGFNRKWLAVLDGGDQTMTNTSGYFDDEEDYIAEGDTSMDWGALMNNRERLTLEMNALEGYRDSAVNETDSSKEADESWDRMYYGNN